MGPSWAIFGHPGDLLVTLRDQKLFCHDRFMHYHFRGHRGDILGFVTSQEPIFDDSFTSYTALGAILELYWGTNIPHTSASRVFDLLSDTDNFLDFRSCLVFSLSFIFWPFRAL